MPDTLNMVPVPGAPNTYQMDPALLSILNTPGQSPYTPELTDQTLAGIRRRQAEITGENVAATQSDFMRRGGTGSSLEALTLPKVRLQGDQAAEDQVLQFMLGAADRTAQDRQFRTGLLFQDYQDRLTREHEDRLASQYMAQLAQQQAEDRKRRRRQGIAQGLTTLAGAGIGALAALPTGGTSVGAGAQAGGAIGSNLPFLFS